MSCKDAMARKFHPSPPPRAGLLPSKMLLRQTGHWATCRDSWEGAQYALVKEDTSQGPSSTGIGLSMKPGNTPQSMSIEV